MNHGETRKRRPPAAAVALLAAVLAWSLLDAGARGGAATSGSPSAAPALSERTVEAVERLDAAMKFQQAHPDQLEEALRRYQACVALSEGTPVRKAVEWKVQEVTLRLQESDVP
jgi:hypothetical protein